MINFQKGSIIHLNLLAKDYDDILEITKGHDEHGFALVRLICKHNYNADEVLKFTEECLPLGVDYEIVVRENL